MSDHPDHMEYCFVNVWKQQVGWTRQEKQMGICFNPHECLLLCNLGDRLERMLSHSTFHVLSSKLSLASGATWGNDYLLDKFLLHIPGPSALNSHKKVTTNYTVAYQGSRSSHLRLARSCTLAWSFHTTHKPRRVGRMGDIPKVSLSLVSCPLTKWG